MGLAAALTLVGSAVVDVGAAAAPIETVRAAAVTGSTPTITISPSAGVPSVGSTLTANPGTWGPSPVTLEYRWYVDDELVSSAGPTYVVQAGDVGENVKVKVFGIRTGYDTVSKTSEKTRKVIAASAPPSAIVGTTPTIAGQPTVGSTLTVSAGSWTPSPVTLAYQWSVAGVPVPGTAGEGTTFVPRSSDVGSAVAVTVTGSKTGYTTTSRTGAATAKVTTAPAAVLSGPTPTISGSATVGSTLTVSAGTWTPSGVTLAYRWYVDGSAVSGSAGEQTSFVVRSGDVGDRITVKVTGSKSGSTSVTKTSAETAKVTAAPATVLSGPTPTISGSATVGSTLTVSAGTWTPSGVTLTYRWYVNGSAVSGSMGDQTSFVVRSEDVGDRVTVRVTGSKAGSTSVTKTSAETAVVTTAPAVEISGPTPTISGTTSVGSTLTVSPGTWSPAPVTLAYRWSVGGVAVTGSAGEGLTFVIRSGDVGKTVGVTVTGSKTGATSLTMTSAVTDVVSSPAPISGPAPTIAGAAAVGSTLTANAGTWSPAPVALAYRWSVGGVSVTGTAGEASTFTVRSADVGKTVTVTVTGSKSGLSSVSQTSAPTGAVSNATALTGPTPLITGILAAGFSLTADPGIWAPSGVTLSYRWYRNGSAISGSGASNQTYSLTSADVGENIVVKVTGSLSGFPSVTKASEQTRKVSASATSGPIPTISGFVRVGSTLTARTGPWTPSDVDLTYRWYVAGALVQDDDEETFVVRPEDFGKTISVAVRGSKSGYAPGTSVSTETAPVTAGVPGELVFFSNFAEEGFDEFEFSLGADRATIVEDPAPDSDRAVVRFDVRNTDVYSGYPRSQFNTSRFFDEGEDYYFNFSTYAPPDTVALNSPLPEKFNEIMLFELHGPPFGAGGPNRLFLNDGKYQLKANNGTSWSMDAPANEWVDFMLHYKMSENPSVGYVALDVFDGANWVHQQLTGSVKDPTSGEYRLYYSTQKDGVNDEDGGNYATWKISYTDDIEGWDEPIDHVEMYMSDMRIGTTREVVDPANYQ